MIWLIFLDLTEAIIFHTFFFGHWLWKIQKLKWLKLILGTCWTTTFVFMSMLKSHCFWQKLQWGFLDHISSVTRSCGFRVHRAGSQLKMFCQNPYQMSEALQIGWFKEIVRKFPKLWDCLTVRLTDCPTAWLSDCLTTPLYLLTRSKISPLNVHRHSRISPLKCWQTTQPHPQPPSPMDRCRAAKNYRHTDTAFTDTNTITDKRHFWFPPVANTNSFFQQWISQLKCHIQGRCLYVHKASNLRINNYLLLIPIRMIRLD